MPRKTDSQNEERASGFRDRRDFLKLTTAGGVGAAALVETALMHHPFAAIVFAQEADSDGMYDPEKKGALAPDQQKDMWHIFAHIGQRWQNAADSTVTAGRLKGIVDLKTNHTPAYYTEYTSASTLLRQLIGRLGSLDAALQHMFTHTGTEGDPQWHASTYVISEFIQLQVALGGFRKWDYVNYIGYPGGMFLNPAHLPYRPYKG
jgi:hypothetical protein